MYSKLGINIKALRKAYGETQSDLLFAIGMEGSSPSTISQYETGERIPERNTLIKIAKHYRITEDELINSDFSGMKNISKKIVNDVETNKIIVSNFFPLITNDVAMKNSHFEQAYNIHLELLDEIIRGEDVNIERLDKCLELYEKAAKEKVFEARANIVGWHMLIAFIFSVITPELAENTSLLKRKNLTVKELVKYGYLPSYDETMQEDTELSADKNIFVNDSIVDVVANIYILKHSDEYSQLADYYLALRHKVGLTASSISYEMENSIGDTMLYDLALMDNPYAKKMLDIT